MTSKRPIRELERDLKREPQNLALRLTLAAAYREAGRAGDAVELYRSVARAYLDQGRNGQAAAVCKSALDLAPVDSELYGMLQHIERTGSQAPVTPRPMTNPPPFGAPAGVPVGSSPALAMATPQPPPMPAPMSERAESAPPARPARVLDADVSAMREVATVAPTVKHVPPPPPRAPSPTTGRHSTLDSETPLPDPLPLHESTSDSLVEMAEVLTGPARSSPSSPSLSVPSSLLGPTTQRSAPISQHARRLTDDDSETIVPLTTVRDPSAREPARDPMPVAAPSPSPLPSALPSPLPSASPSIEKHRRPGPTQPPPGATRPPHPPGLRPPAPPGARAAASPTRPPPVASRPAGPPTRPPPPAAVRQPPAGLPAHPPGASAANAPLPRLTASGPPAPPPRLPRDGRVAPPPSPIDDAPTDHGPGLGSDLSADMVTRKRPKLSAHDLALLDLGPLSATDPDDAVTNPGPPGPAPLGSQISTSSVESTRGMGSSTDVTHRPLSDPGENGTQTGTGTNTERHPAALVDDDDTGETGDTGVAATFDDEPTHPPSQHASAADEGTLRGDRDRGSGITPTPTPTPVRAAGPGQRAATEEGGTATEHGVTFDRSFEGTLSSLGPDGSVLEGPLGVFSMLPNEAAHELARRAVVKQFDPGEIIIREGDPGDACYVIAHGAVVVQRRSEDGNSEPVELARLADGSMFGEFALLADRRRHATVVALSEVEIFEIPRLLLRELAAVFPEVGPALERFYRERLLANLLRTTPLFTLVPEEHRPALLARFHPLHADSGQAIVRQGDRAGGLYLIVLGAVEVVRKVGERRAVVLATLGEGAYFGEMSLLSGEMASASVVAAGPCELAVLPPRDFYDLVAQNPNLWTTMRTVAEARRLANAQITAGHTGVV
ncbi:MAG TPA: cyclic nucleotide-binding domain-containing protein [Kofleriaceae bacterium]|nr:cyclic nucleotide-binding domain-containing protein [Kofleriaceae bacterium]